MEEIAKYMFCGCSSLKSIQLPSKLTTIGENAFYGCGLETAVLPDTVFSIGAYAFSSCKELKSINIPASLTELKYCTFENCTALKELYIPATVTTLGRDMFTNWTEDQTVYFACSEEDTLGWSSTWLKNCNAKIVYNYVKTEAGGGDDARGGSISIRNLL